MSANLILLFSVSFLLSLVNAQNLATVDGRIKITIGTTAGCGDTVRFVQNLVETYALYKEFLDIEFVPWGKTKRNSDGTLECQFGPTDCWANRLHRCALNMLNGNQEAQMHYMTCEFTTPYPSYLQSSYVCANAVGLSLVDVDYCVSNSGPSDPLDLQAETVGQPMTDEFDFVPAIVFNDVINQELHSQSLSRLSSMICFALAADPSTGVTNCSL